MPAKKRASETKRSGKGAKEGATKGGGRKPGKRAQERKRKAATKNRKKVPFTVDDNVFSHFAKATTSIDGATAEKEVVDYHTYVEECHAAQGRSRDVAEAMYPWHPVAGPAADSLYDNEADTRRAKSIFKNTTEIYGHVPSFESVLEAERARLAPPQIHEGEAGPAEEPDFTPTTPTFIDGLKMFRLEWEPTQALRLPAHLPKAIEGVSSAALKIKSVQLPNGKRVTNWAHMLPLKVAAACRMLLRFKTIKSGLEMLLYKMPDTEWARSVILEELISSKYTRDTKPNALEKMLGTTPLQAVMTVLRWSALGQEEHNRDRVAEPAQCRPANWDSQFRWGRYDAVFAMCLDLLTRLLSVNPALYEKGLVNTKASRVVHKHEAIDIVLDNNLLEVIFLFINKSKAYDTGNRARTGKKAVIKKACDQLALLAEQRMSPKAIEEADAAAADGADEYVPTDSAKGIESGCMASMWYAVYPSQHQVALETSKKRGSTFSWDRMKDKKRKSECSGRTGGFGKTTAPTPTEMAICILRGITTSYLREDAAHGVALDRCVRIFDYEYGKPEEAPMKDGQEGGRPGGGGRGSVRGSMKGRKRGMQTCGDLIMGLMQWIKNKGFGYEWYSRETGKVVIETRPHRYFIGAPTRNDAWRVLHNLGTAIGRVEPMSAQGGWLIAKQAFCYASRREGPWQGMSAAKYVMKQWLKMMDRAYFHEQQEMVNQRKPSYLDQKIGVRRIGMLDDTSYFNVTDFASIQLAQFLQGCTPARLELVQDLGFDPEVLPLPSQSPGSTRQIRAVEGREPLAIPPDDLVVRAWIGEQGHEWHPDFGTDVTVGTQMQQLDAGRERKATLHADPRLWGALVHGPPGKNVLVVEVQTITYCALETSGRPINLAPSVEVLRAWFGSSANLWQAGHGKTVTTDVQNLQAARRQRKSSHTLLAKPSMWGGTQGKADNSDAPATLVLQVARPKTPLELLKDLSRGHTEAHQDGREYVHNLSLQRSMLNVWSALVVGCSDEDVLTAVRHAASNVVAMLHDPAFPQFGPSLRGFLIALLGISLQDASLMPVGVWDNTCNAMLEALDYGTLRFRKNIVDDRHWIQPWLHAEKEVMLPTPQVVTTQKSFLGKKKVRVTKDNSKPVYLSVVDLNGRYVEVSNNTGKRFDLSAFAIRLRAVNEIVDPADLKRIDTQRKLEAAGEVAGGNAAFVATFVFPRGCVLGGSDDASTDPVSFRVWHPCVSRSYGDSELLFSTYVDTKTGNISKDFDPRCGDLTWMPPKDPQSARHNREGGRGTTWLDPMVRRDKDTVDLLRRSIVDPVLREALPEVPYSSTFASHGMQLLLYNPEGGLVDMVDLTAPPPKGTLSLDGSGSRAHAQPAAKWFEHGAGTARTATQWADPDRASVGFHGLFVEPSYVLKALRNFSLQPLRAYQLIQRGTLASVVDLLLELRLLRLEQQNSFCTRSCFDATALQRVNSEITALDQVCALVQPFKTQSRILFSSLIVPGLQKIEAEPSLFPMKMDNSAHFAWDVVDDGRSSSTNWAPSSWAAPLDLGRLLLHFESEFDDNAQPSSGVTAQYRVCELAAVAWTTLCLRNLLESVPIDRKSDRTPLEQLVLASEKDYSPHTDFDFYVSFSEHVDVDHPAHVATRKRLKLHGTAGFEDAYRRLAAIFCHDMPKMQGIAEGMPPVADGGAVAGPEPADATPLKGKCLIPKRRTARLCISDTVKRSRNPFALIRQREIATRMKMATNSEAALGKKEKTTSFCPSEITASILRSKTVVLLLGPEFFESEYCKLELRIALLHCSRLVPVFVAPGYTLNDVPTEFREDIRAAVWCWHIDVWQIKNYNSLLMYSAAVTDNQPGDHLRELVAYIRSPDPRRPDLKSADYMLAKSDDEYSDYFSAMCTFCGQVRNDVAENLRTRAEACDECWNARLRPTSAEPLLERKTSLRDEYSELHAGFCAFCEKDVDNITANVRTGEEACEDCWAQDVSGYVPKGVVAECDVPEGEDSDYLHVGGADHVDGADSSLALGKYATPESSDAEVAALTQVGAQTASAAVYTALGDIEGAEYADEHVYTDPEGSGPSAEAPDSAVWAHPPENADDRAVEAPTPDYSDTTEGDTDVYMGFGSDPTFVEEDTYFGPETTTIPLVKGDAAAGGSVESESDSDDEVGLLAGHWKARDDHEEAMELDGEVEAAILTHERETSAATTIQAAFRASRSRDSTSKLRARKIASEDATLDNDIEATITQHEAENVAATTIQAAFRAKLARDNAARAGDQTLDDDIESAVTQHERECAAAALIQASFRGKRARDGMKDDVNKALDTEIEGAVEEHESQSIAAVHIQAAWRGKRCRDSMKAEQDRELDAAVEGGVAEHERETAAATTIQAGFRGMKARRDLSASTAAAISVAQESPVTERKPIPPPKPAQLRAIVPPPKQAGLGPPHATSRFCASCGAKQPKTAVRFCPRCGQKCAELAEREDTAATKIQASFRGMMARRSVATARSEGALDSSEDETSVDEDTDDDSSIDDEEALAEYLAEAERELEAATVRIQSAFRGSKARAQVRAMRASMAPAAAEEGDDSGSDVELTVEELAAIDAELAGVVEESTQF